VSLDITNLDPHLDMNVKNANVILMGVILVNAMILADVIAMRGFREDIVTLAKMVIMELIVIHVIVTKLDRKDIVVMVQVYVNVVQDTILGTNVKTVTTIELETEHVASVATLVILVMVL